MKNSIYAAMLLLGLGMMISCGGNDQGKTENKETTNTESQVVPSVEEAEPVDTRPRVYACAYDAFVNIRETPNPQAPVLGVFRNGPEGAVLLGTEGEWTKIDCDGIIGYVISKFVQGTPTVAYTGKATIDDIAGIYRKPDDYDTYFFYFDGSYRIGCGNGYTFETGNYYFQNNELKLVPVSGLYHVDTKRGKQFSDNCVTRDDPNFEFEIHQIKILAIDIEHKKIGEFAKQPFITEKEIVDAKEDCGDEAWLYCLTCKYCGDEDPCCYLITVKDFKKLSAFDYK